MGVTGELLLQAGLLPALGATAALVLALGGRAPWRQRLVKLGNRLAACVAALAVLLAVAAVGHWLGWGRDDGCQPSPNGRICEPG